MNRNITKLKKIFECCGRCCNSSTNGEVIDHLLELAENGKLDSTRISQQKYIYGNEAVNGLNFILGIGKSDNYVVGCVPSVPYVKITNKNGTTQQAVATQSTTDPKLYTLEFNNLGMVFYVYQGIYGLLADPNEVCLNDISNIIVESEK